MSRLFSVNRLNFLSFHEADHIDTRISPLSAGLRAYVDALCRTADMPPPRRVLLLAYPRVFGHAFNPISVYYAYDAAEALGAVIYEVRNTFGERHAYVCPVRPGEMSDAGLRQSCPKADACVALRRDGRENMTFAFCLPAPRCACTFWNATRRARFWRQVIRRAPNL